MRKSYLLVAAALLVAASCQKNDNASSVEGIKYNPIDVVLSAAIEGVDTKVSYTEDANVLKAAWKANDKISLVALMLPEMPFPMTSLRQLPRAPLRSSAAHIPTLRAL